MSTVTNKDLHTPFTTATIKKIRGRIGRATSEQLAAANLTELCKGGVATVVGKLRSVFLINKVAPSGTESMVFIIAKNGTTIISTADYTVSSTTPIGVQIELPLSATAAVLNVNVGDTFTVQRTYTAGTPVPMTATMVGIEWA